MRPAVAAIAVLALASCASAPEATAARAATGFDYARYAPASLAEAEKPADGICTSEYRQSHVVDFALTPMRLEALATHEFRPVAEDSARIVSLYFKATKKPMPPHFAFAEEVRVRIDGQDRWLPIQPQVKPFWLDELAAGQPVHLYVTRFGCVLPVDRGADRAILSINEFQVEPIGPPEPAQ